MTSSLSQGVGTPVEGPSVSGIGPRRDHFADEAASKRGSVDIVGLVKRFGDFVAVDHLDLSVAPGEFISLLGPSGCGKTTTLRMLAGFEFPDEGLLSVSGVSVSNLPPHRRDVNTVFQAYALFPHMTVAENVAFGLRQHRTPRAEVSTRVAEALRMVRMLPMADRRPPQLSGGQQQRVALARALVNRPSVLLLDEPLAALDRKLREEMQIELKLMQKDLGITFIFVTHDQGEALSMSDRIAVMRAGRIEQLADPYTIYDAPSSSFVAGFIGQQNFFRGTFDGPVRRVSTQYGSFVAERGEPIVSGRALVAVRPEVIRIANIEGLSDDGNSVVGILASIAHLGDVLQYVVLVGAMELIVRTPRASARRLELGARVICTFSADDAYLFEDTGDVDETSQCAEPQM